MRSSLVATGFLFATSVLAQSPTPQQIEQAREAVRSGAVEVTPELIDKAQQQFPDLKNVPDAQLKREAEIMKTDEQSGDGSKSGEAGDPVALERDESGEDASRTLEDGADESDEDPVSRRQGSGSGRRSGSSWPGFPQGLERFGHDFFRNIDGAGLGPNAPAVPEYILSPGDEIQINTWGREARAQSAVIDKEGMLYYPPLSPLRLAGLRFGEAQDLLVSEIEKIHGVSASISLGRLQGVRVMVLGEARRPGSYTLPAGATVTSALFRSGGVTNIGSLRQIEVRRKGKVAARIDLYDMLLGGKSGVDIQLLPGDAIFVPIAKVQVAVHGGVKRPAIYEVKPGTRALDAVALAGDLSPAAHRGRLRLDRVEDNSRKVVLDVDMNQVTRRNNVVLENGDVLHVEFVLPKTEQVVYLEGNVNRAGRYQYRPGMTVKDLIKSPKDLKPETYLEYAHIRRESKEDGSPMLERFSLRDVLEGRARVFLQPRDAVVIYNRYQVQERPTVSVSGSVRNGGTFGYRDGMKVSDLVVLAGGLRDVHLPEAHLRRMVYEEETDTLYTELLRVNLRKVLENPESPENLAIQPFDALSIFPRSIFEPSQTVGVNGAVRTPGTFAMVAQMRLTDLIVLGGGLNDAHLLEAHLRREVVVPERDSTYYRLMRVRLRDAIEHPEGEANLLLEPFDLLTVFPRDQFRTSRTVAVYGTVRNGGEYRLVENMGIPELIQMAGGLTKSSYTLEIEVARRTVVNDSVMKRDLKKMSLQALLDGRETFALQDGDGVYVREISQYRERSRITLRGEFAFPGVYEFVPGEKLSSVIKRAGGFTREAYLRGAVFLRNSVKTQQLRHAEEVGRRLENQLQARLQQTTIESERQALMLAMNRREQLLREIAAAPYLGRVVIKIDQKMRFAGGDWDLELEDGDELYVGPRVSTVSVLGEVSSPTTVVHTRRTNQIGEVLARAGGVNMYGNYNETFYIGPDGSITTPRTTPWWSSFKGTKVEPGGTVIVPLKPPARDYLEVWALSTQILYQLAITVGVAATLF